MHRWEWVRSTFIVNDTELQCERSSFIPSRFSLVSRPHLAFFFRFMLKLDVAWGQDNECSNSLRLCEQL